MVFKRNNRSRENEFDIGASKNDVSSEKTSQSDTSDQTEIAMSVESTINEELRSMMEEEIRSAAREIVEEQKMVIKAAVEENKKIIREVLEQEKMAIALETDDIRRRLIRYGMMR